MKRESQPKLSWLKKFAVAFRGIYLAVRYERSCWVHLAITIAIILAAIFFRLSLIEWGLLTISATMVWSAELMNTAIERLCEIHHRAVDPKIGALLDIAAGGVLIAALGACLVGTMVFIPHLISLFFPA